MHDFAQELEEELYGAAVQQDQIMQPAVFAASFMGKLIKHR